MVPLGLGCKKATYSHRYRAGNEFCKAADNDYS
jgi:hypothetical protein